MNENNPFIVGSIVTGDSFIGREEEISSLSIVFSDHTSGIHLFGVTRIGKSSLADAVIRLHKNTPNRVTVKLAMSEYPNAFSFWHGLARQLRKAIKTVGIEDEELDERIAEVNKMAGAASFTPMKEALYDVLLILGESYGYRLVLIIDEFDSAKRVFDDDPTNYQVLRTLYYDPGCYTSGILISRMALREIEERCPDVSSFSGVFDEVPLKAFSDKDMEAFYVKMNECGVVLSESGRDRFEYYTGRLPMLCCMLAKNMVIQKSSRFQYDGEDVRQMFFNHLPKTEQYYSDLRDRLKADGLLEVAMYLAFGMQIPVMSSRRISNLITYGILALDKLDKEKDGNGYYVFSKDFMDYLKYVPLSLPVWETITLSEKKIKDIFSKEYKKLSEIRYSEFGGKDKYKYENEINGLYPELSLDWNQIRSYGRNSSSYMQNPSILDVLTLPYIISVINRQWSTKFYRFFGSDDWKDKLQKISNLRNPIAHAHIDYISPDALAEGLSCCNEVIRLP